MYRLGWAGRAGNDVHAAPVIPFLAGFPFQLAQLGAVAHIDRFGLALLAAIDLVGCLVDPVGIGRAGYIGNDGLAALRAFISGGCRIAREQGGGQHQEAGGTNAHCSHLFDVIWRDSRDYRRRRQLVETRQIIPPLIEITCPEM